MKDCNVHHMTTGGVCRDCGTPWSAMTANQHEDAVRVATPPTPDPRERGEDAWTIVRKALLDACAVDRNPLHKYEHVSARLDAIAAQCADRVLALRATAPSEAVAWQLVHTRTGQRWTPATDRASVENQQREFAALGATETRIAALVDHHPAPARGVTVTEAMVDKAARYLCDRRNDFVQMYDSDHPLHWHETAVAVLTAALTPDAEGGA